MLKENRNYKNIHKGKRCFIIGNGPSLKEQDLTLLRNEITFVTNSFPLAENFENLNINYHCVSDPVFWDYGRGFESNIYNIIDRNQLVIKFYEYKAKDVIERQGLFKDHEIAYLHLDFSKKVFNGDVSFNIEHSVGWGRTVIIDFCLPIAFYMGFREIYILGCDMDFKFKDNGKAYSHFYKHNKMDEKATLTEAKYDTWSTNVFDAYKEMNKAFKNDHRMIYNATAGGKLNVFSRVEYESLF